MKKFTLLLIALATVFVLPVKAQNVQRSYVVLEIATGTWCVYCPGAAGGADQLVDEGESVAVIENHNGDSYANTYSNARNSYYGISSFPTAKFDGIVTHSGGQACPTANIYSTYLPLYNQRMAVTSPLTVCVTGTNVGNNYTVNVALNKVGTITSTDLKLHLVLTESNIAVTWFCLNDIDFVTRLMVPDQNGTTVSFNSGNLQSYTLNFARDPNWVAANCELVAFVQDNSTKEILNAFKVPLTNIPTNPIGSVDFTADVTSGCSPVTVTFTNESVGATQFNWSFPGGTPSSSTMTNPVVTYNTAGTFDVTLIGSDGACAVTTTKTSYINITSAPVAPGMPQGESSLCNTAPIQTYSTGSIANATSYTWDLTPPESGVLTPNGTSCTIDWNDTWAGTAQLKVQAANDCGPGPWSSVKSILLSEKPGQCATPTGPASLCMNPDDTQYTTAGATNATYYVWSLQPSDAGTIMPDGTSATVFWNDTFTGQAFIKAKGINGTCEGDYSDIFTVTVSANPAVFNTTGGGIYCAQGGSGVPVGLDGSQTDATYSLFVDGTLVTQTPGTGAALDFGNVTATGSYTITAELTTTGCSNDMQGTATVATDPQEPLAPADPSGPSVVYITSTPTSDYNTSGGTYATTYSWELTPNIGGTIAGNGQTCTVTWDLSKPGNYTVKVQGVNSCGGGSFSNEFPVTVYQGVGVVDPKEAKPVWLNPNPASDVVTITPLHSMIADITIINSVGKQEINLSKVTLGTGYKLNISKLLPGIYYVRVSNSEINQTLKLVVK
jgi:PKD repeat protein